MVYLLDKLSKINDFTLQKIEPARINGDKMPYEKPLVEEGSQSPKKIRKIINFAPSRHLTHMICDISDSKIFENFDF